MMGNGNPLFWRSWRERLREETNMGLYVAYTLRAGIVKWVGMSLLGVTAPFGGGNENLRKPLGKPSLKKNFDSPDGTDIVTVSPGEITRSLAAGVSQKAVFGGADWQANIRLPAMPETRWTKMTAQLWNLLSVPSPKNKVNDPIIRVKTSKLSYGAHRVLIRKLLTREKHIFNWPRCSISNAFENIHVKQDDDHVQGDHLGMYLKQTPGWNIYWQTQRNITHRSNTQGGPFYLWHKTIPYLEQLAYRTWSKWHPALWTGAARLDVGRVLLFSPDQFMLLTKGMHRRLQLWRDIDLHFICLCEM